MRPILIAVLAFHWAMVFGAFAVAALVHPPPLEGGRTLFALCLAGANSTVAALFLGLGIDWLTAGRGRVNRLAPAAFIGATLLFAFDAAMNGPLAPFSNIFAPVAALGATYALVRLEGARPRQPVAMNDNKSLGARLMAAGAARMALMCEPDAERRNSARLERY